MNKAIGIVTLTGNFNYGNRLQLYASYAVYSMLGFQPTVLVPEDRDGACISSLIKGAAKSFLGKESAPSKIEDMMSPERLDAFRRFSSLMDTLVVPKRCERKTARSFHAVSVGSDQVWNPYYFHDYQDWYFLKFANPSQRIALAPSIGLSTLDKRQMRAISHGIQGFDRLSVREQRGAELIYECTGRDAEVICDPTLVIDKGVWRSLSSDAITPVEPYVFTYLLGRDDGTYRTLLDKITDGGRIQTIALNDRENKGDLPAGPAEFIDLIDHAKHVVTDSFHASVFSILMETPLSIVKRGGNGGGMFSRLDSLSTMMGLEDRIYGSPQFSLDHAGDYRGVNSRIRLEQDHFMSYLKSCLKGC